ncbi:MAG: hypothetical protein PHE51_10060 [Eubacteriales bacterium]|nr:hypothetical protein [Eubacteriales bacterium]
MAVITPFIQASPRAILSGETVTLTWGGSGAGATYDVQRSVDNGSRWIFILNSTTTTTYNLTLTQNNLFRVRASVGGVLSAFSEIESVQIVAPLTVPVITVSPTSLPVGGLATISWTDSGTGADYDIQKSIDRGGTWANIATGITSLSITDHVFKTTQYRVRAKKGSQITEWSYSLLISVLFPRMSVKVGSEVRNAVDGWVMVNGTLRKITDMWVMVNGTLRKS